MPTSVCVRASYVNVGGFFVSDRHGLAPIGAFAHISHLDIYVLTDSPLFSFSPGGFMYRGRVHRGRSAKSFRRRASKTDRANLSSPLRGGWRL